MKKTSGEVLRGLRAEKSLDEVATSIGVSKQAISNYENDIRTPRDEIKVRLAEYFGKTVQEIFFTD